MGIENGVRSTHLNPVRFGVLIKGRYEFRYREDDRPWFYENRTRKVEGRYMIVVDGEEFFTLRELQEKFPFVPRSIDSIPAFVTRLREINPELRIELIDSATNDVYLGVRAYKKRGAFFSKYWIYDTKEDKEIILDTTEDVKNFFGVSSTALGHITKTMGLYRGRYAVTKLTNKTRIEDYKKRFNIRTAVNKLI